MELTHDVIQNLKTKSRIGASRPAVGAYNSGVTKLGSAGWKDLGAANPGSFSFDMPKEVFETDTGTPVTTKSRDITRWGATVNFELYDYTGLALQELIGTTVNTDYVAALSPNQFSGTIDATGSTRSVIAINSAASITASLNVGETIAVVLGTVGVAGGTWKEAGKVIERDTALNTVTIEGDGFSEIPPAGAAVYKVAYENTIVGGNELSDKKFRTVTSLTNGEMLVLFFPKCNSVEGLSPNYQDGTSAILLPGSFSAIGIPQTVPDGPSDRQVVVAEHTKINKIV
jgi:hypothetical protein